MLKLSKAVFDIAIIMSMFGMLFYVIYNTLLLPEVRFSNATGECVEVINYDDSFQYTCENLPEKYHSITVQ